MEGDMQDKLAQPQLEDTQIVHAAPGEMVVPPVISNTTQQLINRDMQAVGLNPQDYVVGSGQINQLTGLQQFGFLSKVFKKIKNVVKKVAPIAVSFIPGIGPIAKGALTAVAGKASGMDTKSALLGGLTAGLGAKFAGSGAGAASKVADKGIFGGTLGPRLKSGLGSFFKPGDQATGIFGGQIGPNLRRGIGNLFSPGQMGAGGQQEIVYQDENGNIYTASQVNEMIAAGEMPGTLTEVQTGMFGGTLGPKLKNFFLGNQQQGQGGLLSGLGQIGQGQGGMLGGNAGLAALAALYGAAVKKQAEKREGGLRDIRASRRPDLAAQPVFQGFDLGVRPGMAYGGTAMGRPGFAKGGALNPDLFELDYRQVGGPTIGIGTGTSDDIPAMLSDGEYVFTTSANNGAGAFDISKSKDSIMLTPDGKPNREKGAKNLGLLMDMFEDTDKRLS
tara:strand:- start:1800 stop:3137 length:1338 start_codon:yes stop_codon:yes gene_type:complete